MKVLTIHDMLYVLAGLILCKFLGAETFQGNVPKDIYLLSQKNLRNGLENGKKAVHKMVDSLVNKRLKRLINSFPSIF